MPLFQVTGVTDHKSVANFAFGVINTETEAGYRWLCRQINLFQLRAHINEPAVIITDKEAALRNVLKDVFPRAQQQLCVYHINANIRSRIYSRWKKPGPAVDDDKEHEVHDPESPDPLIAPDNTRRDRILGPNNDKEEKERVIESIYAFRGRETGREVDDSPEGLYKA
jgi:hypothetical protein